MARFRLKIRLSYGPPATAGSPMGRHKYGGWRRGLAEPRGVEPLAPLLRTRLLSQPSYGPRLKRVFAGRLLRCSATYADLLMALWSFSMILCQWKTRRSRPF